MNSAPDETKVLAAINAMRLFAHNAGLENTTASYHLGTSETLVELVQFESMQATGTVTRTEIDITLDIAPKPEFPDFDEHHLIFPRPAFAESSIFQMPMAGTTNDTLDYLKNFSRVLQRHNTPFQIVPFSHDGIDHFFMRGPDPADMPQIIRHSDELARGIATRMKDGWAVYMQSPSLDIEGRGCLIDKLDRIANTDIIPPEAGRGGIEIVRLLDRAAKRLPATLRFTRIDGTKNDFTVMPNAFTHAVPDDADDALIDMRRAHMMLTALLPAEASAKA